MSPPVIMYVCDDLPFSDELPDHTDSDTAPEHLVEYCVASRDKFAAVAHDISQNTGRAGQSMSNGIDECLYGLRFSNLHRCEISERGKRRTSETVTKPPVGNTAIDGGGLL